MPVSLSLFAFSPLSPCSPSPSFSVCLSPYLTHALILTISVRGIASVHTFKLVDMRVPEGGRGGDRGGTEGVKGCHDSSFSSWRHTPRRRRGHTLQKKRSLFIFFIFMFLSFISLVMCSSFFFIYLSTFLFIRSCLLSFYFRFLSRLM